MAVFITSSLRMWLISGTGVSFSAPVVPALTTDDIYNADNPSETLTSMFEETQEDVAEALANSVTASSLVAGSPPRPGEAPGLFGQTKTGSIDNAVPINPEWVATSTSGKVIRVYAPTGLDPQTIAPIAPVDFDSGQFYIVRWRVQRQTNPIDSSPVKFGICWMDADKNGLDGGTAIIDNIPLNVDDGVQEVSIVVGRDTPPDIVAPAGAVYFRPFIDLYGDSHVTDIIALETHDSVGLLPDASNAALPAAMNNISAGRITMDQGLLTKMRIGPTASTGAAKPEVPFTLVTSAPVQTDTKAFYVLHRNNGVPLDNAGAMYGGIVSAVQDVPCTITDTGNARYVGLFGTGAARAIGGEGGVDTTLAVSAVPGQTTIMVTDATGFISGVNVQVVTDHGMVDSYGISETPVGNTITLTNPIVRAAAAGNVVYRWRGSVKGLGAQASTATGSTGMLMVSAEFDWSAQSGSRPYVKSGLFLGANADDVEPAVSPYDSGIMMSRQTGSVGAKVGIGFSPISGTNLVNSSGTLIKTFLGGYTNGIDFSNSNFSGDAFASPGFRVTGIGNPIINNVAPQLQLIDTDLTPTAGGVWRITVGDAGILAFQANTSVNGDFATALTPITLTGTGDTLIGQSAVIPTTSTTRLLFIPTMTGPPTGVPAQATAGRTALVWNSGTKRLHVYDQASGTWFSSAVFT